MLTTKRRNSPVPHDPRSINVDVDGGSLFVEVTGAGAPLLMIHGWPLDHRLFARQIGPLGESFQVITYDRRGFGRSTAPPNLRAELDDIDRLLDALGHESVHILGMSQGGRIALRYAVTRPEQVRSLILQGAVVDGLDVEQRREERIPVAEFAALAKVGNLDAVISRWLAHPMMRLPPSDPEASCLVRDILRDYSGSDLIDFDPDAYEFKVDVLDRMSAFARPVLIITGAAETETRHAHAEELLRRVPNGREVVLQRSGHLANLTEPEAYNRAVTDFVHDVEKRPA